MDGAIDWSKISWNVTIKFAWEHRLEIAASPSENKNKKKYNCTQYTSTDFFFFHRIGVHILYNYHKHHSCSTAVKFLHARISIRDNVVVYFIYRSSVLSKWSASNGHQTKILHMPAQNRQIRKHLIRTNL